MSNRTRTDALFFEKDSSVQGNLVPTHPISSAPETAVFSLQLRQRLLKEEHAISDEKKPATPQNESLVSSLRRELSNHHPPSNTRELFQPSRPAQTVVSIPTIDEKLFRILMIFSMDGEMLHGRFGGRLPAGFLARRFQQVIRPGISCTKSLLGVLGEEEIRTELCVHQERWLFLVEEAQDVVVVGEVGERCDQNTFASLARAFLQEYRLTVFS